GARPVLRDVPGGLRPPPVPAVLRRTPPTPVSERNAGCAAGRPRPAPSAPVSAPLPPRPALGRIGAVRPGPAARAAWGGGDVSPSPAGGPGRAASRPDASPAVSEGLLGMRPVAQSLRPQTAPRPTARVPFTSAPRPCAGTRVPGPAVRLPRSGAFLLCGEFRGAFPRSIHAGPGVSPLPARRLALRCRVRPGAGAARISTGGCAAVGGAVHDAGHRFFGRDVRRGHGDREPAGGGAYVSTAVVCGPVLPRSRPRQGQGGPAAAVRADRGRAAVGPGGAVRADPGRDGGVQPAGGGVRGGRERDRDDRAGGDRRGLLVRRLGLRVHRRRCGGAGRRPVLVKGRR